jgi:L-iditol 2-dehydrogenase
MKAAVLYGKETVRVEDVPETPLKPGEVRIRIQAALTCGTDLKVYKRGYHAKMIVPPAVFGHELAGVISETTPEARHCRVGDRVVVANSAPCGVCYYCAHHQENLCDDLLFLNGAYAESIVVPARLAEKNLIQLSPGTHFADAALTEPLACVVQGIEDLGLRAGQNVLVLGSGPIGLMFVVLAKHLGCQVALAGRGQSRLDTGRKLGAEIIFDVGQGDLLSVVKPNPVQPFDVVFEAVGKPEAWEAAVQLVRKGGAVNFFGGCPANTTVTLDTGRIHYSSISLLASFHHTPKTIRQALGYIEKGIVRAADFVTGQCELSNLPSLFQSMAQGNRAVKTLIDVQR